MRSSIRLLALGLFVLIPAGCESTRWNWLKRDTQDPQQQTAPVAAPTTVALIDYLNDNASRIRSIKVEEMAIDVSIENQSFSVSGRIFSEKPRSFRMNARSFGKDEVDVGSNEQEFWFWARSDPNPHQYFCSYKDLNEGRVRMLPLPIQPEWVMEAMGLGPYGPADKYQLDQDSQSFRLVEHAKSPTGTSVRKVIVMNRHPVRSPQPQVTGYYLLDDTTGQEICSAQITKTTVDRVSGAILPYKMELRMPKHKLKLALKMDGMTINSTIPATLFVRPQLTGVDPFNIATGRTEPSGVQRAKGIGAGQPR